MTYDQYGHQRRCRQSKYRSRNSPVEQSWSCDDDTSRESKRSSLSLQDRLDVRSSEDDGLLISQQSKSSFKPVDAKPVKKQQLAPLHHQQQSSNSHSLAESSLKSHVSTEMTRVQADGRLLMQKESATGWEQSQLQCWQCLVAEAPKFKERAALLAALDLLVECYPYLVQREDQENLVDMVYDYCEADVPIENRKLGCDLLFRLSEKSAESKLIQRNVDVLFQLLCIVADDKAHLDIITQGLQQHLINFSEPTLRCLFVMNLRPGREEKGQWQGPCLAFVNEQVHRNIAKNFKLEVELCRCLAEEWTRRRLLKDLLPSDMELFVGLIDTLQFDLKSFFTDGNTAKTSEIEVVQRACRSVSTIAGAIIDELIVSQDLQKRFQDDAKEASDNISNDPSSLIVLISELKSVLQQVITLYRRFRVDKDRIVAFAKALEYLLLPSIDEEQRMMEPPLLCLPETTRICFIRRLCSLSSNSSTRFTNNPTRVQAAREGVLWTIQSFFPCVERYKDALDAHRQFDIELAEALLLTCSFLYPIKPGQKNAGLEATAIKSRLQTLLAISQTIVSAAKVDASIEGIPSSSLEQSEGKVQAARRVYQIAAQYLKPAHNQVSLDITVPWLEKAEAKSEMSATKKTNAEPENNPTPAKRQKCAPHMEIKVPTEDTTTPGSANSIDASQVVTVRGRGHTYAPPTSSPSPRSSLAALGPRRSGERGENGGAATTTQMSRACSAPFPMFIPQGPAAHYSHTTRFRSPYSAPPHRHERSLWVDRHHDRTRHSK